MGILRRRRVAQDRGPRGAFAHRTPPAGTPPLPRASPLAWPPAPPRCTLTGCALISWPPASPSPPLLRPCSRPTRTRTSTPRGVARRSRRTPRRTSGPALRGPGPEAPPARQGRRRGQGRAGVGRAHRAVHGHRAGAAEPAVPAPAPRAALPRARRQPEEAGRRLREARRGGRGRAWAARVVLGGVYKQDGRYDDAIRTYQAGHRRAARDPAAHARARRSSRRTAATRRRRGPSSSRRLPLLKAAPDVEQTTRALLGLCLDLEGLRRRQALPRGAGQGGAGARSSSRPSSGASCSRAASSSAPRPSSARW